jgi:hypothetical protein
LGTGIEVLASPAVSGRLSTRPKFARTEPYREIRAAARTPAPRQPARGRVSGVSDAAIPDSGSPAFRQHAPAFGCSCQEDSMRQHSPRSRSPLPRKIGPGRIVVRLEQALEKVTREAGCPIRVIHHRSGRLGPDVAG